MDGRRLGVLGSVMRNAQFLSNCNQGLTDMCFINRLPFPNLYLPIFDTDCRFKRSICGR